MIHWIAKSSQKLRFLVVVMAAVMTFLGITQLRDVSLDLLPELAPPNAEGQIRIPNLSAAEVESFPGHSLLAKSFSKTPVNFKIAFIGDQGLKPNAQAVLNLIKSEGAHAVLHQGDFDYKDDPAAWDGQINHILGVHFPYFASIGNHEKDAWDGRYGYQRYLQDRLNRLAITWDGDLGVKSSLRYRGIFIILVGPGIMGSGHDVYIRDKVAADNSIWSICSWHKNMRKMQMGNKSDDTRWEVYEESRKGGAIIATAHEHSYSRTHLLSSIKYQTVASTSNTLVITKGKTFVFVSGLGGEGIRGQQRCLPSTPPYGCKGEWASIYTSDQNANYGALFGVFNLDGIPNRAKFYFQNIDGKIVDEFLVISNVEDPRPQSITRPIKSSPSVAE
jgi:hypothetical protein